MRSVKRAGRPVRRYRSLVSPGIAVLAVLMFYAAFVSPKTQKGETARFEQDGLCLEVTGVHHTGGFVGNFGDKKPFDAYRVYPGSVLTVLEASGERWELRWGEDEALALADGMDPVELTEEFNAAVVYDLDAGRTLLQLWITDEDEEYWK